MNDWFNPMDPPDFWLCPGTMTVPPVEETIWTPCWLDAYPPMPCLCSAWGGMQDVSSRSGGWV
jgi:hypothetical protein